MDVTIKLSGGDLEAIKQLVQEEFVSAVSVLMSELTARAKSKTLKADRLEEQAQAAIAEAKAQAKPEITDDDLPPNMQPGVKNPGATEGLLPFIDADRSITEEDKKEFGPRVRALALGSGVLKEWIKRNTGHDEPWAIGYYRFKLMLDMFEAKKAESRDSIAKFIAGF